MMTSASTCVLLIAFHILELAQVSSWIVDFNNPIVHTQYGSIQGKIDDRKTKFNRRPICTFLSIPFARPPIGQNRFLPPLEPDTWQHLEAVSKRVMCPQIEQRFRISISSNDPIIESEDCLYLNVFVPVDRATPVINYPVIVYIHGGEFKHGSKDHYSPEYLLDHGIILVTVNYRLGVFGFLSTNDLAAPGNVGLYDQIAALRWVKRNIQSFGGNNDDIAIMGHNAGAISASLLLLAPHETQGLISKAVLVGGSALSPAALQWNPARQSAEFARELRCADKRTDKLVQCLRLKDWRALVEASRRSHDFERNQFRFWFRPVIDRNSTISLIRDTPISLYKQGAFLKVPLLAGATSHEGSLEFFLHWHQLRPLSSLERMRFLIAPYLYEFARAEIVATTLDYQYVRRMNASGFALTSGSQFGSSGQHIALNSQPLVLATRLTASGQFWHEQNIGLERNQNLDVYISPNDYRSRQVSREIDAIGDFLFVGPLIKTLELHSAHVTQAYFYVFDYKGVRSFGHLQLNPYGRAINADGELITNGWLPATPTATGALVSTEMSNFGVAHCDDLFYVLPNDFSPADPRMHAAGVASQGAYPALGASASNAAVSAPETGNDDNAARNYVTYLAAFASRVNEHSSAANNLANWLPFRATDRNYLRFSEQVPALYKNFHQSDVSFVNELVEPLEELVNTPLPLFPYEDLRDYKLSTAALAALLALLVLTLCCVLALLASGKARAKRRRRRAQFSNVRESPTQACVQLQRPIAAISGSPLAHTNAAANPQAPQQATQQHQQQHQLQQQSTQAPAEAHLSGRLSRLSQRYDDV